MAATSVFFFFSSRRRHTRWPRDWSSDVCSSDLRLTRSSKFHIQGAFMAFATPDQYAEMIDAAKTGGYAYPAINVTSSQTLNAALRGFAEAESDGIIQISNGEIGRAHV